MSDIYVHDLANVAISPREASLLKDCAAFEEKWGFLTPRLQRAQDAVLDHIDAVARWKSANA